MPLEMLDPMRGTLVYASLLAMAPTLVYDGEALGGDDHSLPVELLAAAPAAVAAALPHGRAVTLEGGFHEVPVATLAPVLAQFYTAAD